MAIQLIFRTKDKTHTHTNKEKERRGRGRSMGDSKIMMLLLMSIIIIMMMLGVKEVHASRFVVEKASLRVFVDGVRLGEYDAALGDFGFPLYGRVLAGQVRAREDEWVDNDSVCKIWFNDVALLFD